MVRASFFVLAALGLGSPAMAAPSAAEEMLLCGDAKYQPTKYICYFGNFLCPIVAGEPLSYCSGACYSKFMYTCTNNVLVTLPLLTPGTPFTLTASNPTIGVNGKPLTANGRHVSIGGITASYCPAQVGSGCPSGTTTAFFASGGTAAMDVMVPGGQQVYLDPYWNIGYTQAHSASFPSGSLTTGFAAYKGGGLVNLNGNGWGWVACPPTAKGGGDGSWNLVAKNDTNANNLKNCYAVNLKINELPRGTIGAWQYT